MRAFAWDDSKKVPRFLPQTVDFKRLPRKTLRPDHLHGSLGAYDRSIACVAFSADSRILAVGDLSGHIDTWVLEGHEDMMQDPPMIRPNDDSMSSSSSTGSSDESDSSDEEGHPTLVYAQHWKRNPTAHLIPKLASGPLVMSFRPTILTSLPPKALTNGNGHLHPTRHNPYPHSHDLPTGEDRLFIVTAEHQFHEINVLAGRISDWSRRNPTSILPDEFNSLKDRAMGCVWDVASSALTNLGRERIWLYGNTWLWMFDLAQDLPRSHHDEDDSDEPHTGELSNKSKLRKRKREEVDRKRDLVLSMDHDDDASSGTVRKERDTGAGSRIAPHEMTTGVGRKMRKTTGAKGEDARLVRLGRYVSDESGSEDEDEEDAEDQALMRLRRGEAVTTVNGDGDDTVEEGAKSQRVEMRKGPPYWGTFKYRPILGIVPIGEAEGDEDDEVVIGTDGERTGGRRAVEVALVERPMFDVDLPGRYYGDQEWSEKKDADVRL